MRTITFYSYKGGVGRTLTAANFAAYLAKLGQKTLVIDFDLEAPGIDSKFPLLQLPQNHRGLLDYVLEYQQTNTDPGNVKPLCLQVPLESSGELAPLWVIPAGDYLSLEYYRNLNQLNWDIVFSAERAGVAFFQEFLARIETELQPDFVVIDSRTGISEIAGLCTQQLADEVVMLSSLSSEGIKVTKHIKKLIQQSEIAKQLGKSIDVKVVVSRVPKPKDDLEVLKNRCCELFDVEETKLFFLFSCPLLEQEEFLAIATPGKDEELISGYLRLFYGLKIELASAAIKAEIERTTSGLLSVSPEESEKRIQELVALYPHPDAYRAAMHFFRLVRKTESLRAFGWKLLDLVPNDAEAQTILAKSYLSVESRLGRLEPDARRNALRVMEPLWQRGELSPAERVRYADLLEDADQYSKSMEVALPLQADEQLDVNVQVQARSIAARCALKLGQKIEAIELVRNLPPEKLSGSLAGLAMEDHRDAGDLNGAFEMAKRALQQDLSPEVLEEAASFARQLERIPELEEVIWNSDDFRGGLLRRSKLPSWRGRPELIESLMRVGLPDLARKLRERF